MADARPKVALTKVLDSFRAPRGAFRVLDVPERRYLMIDGRGDPNTAPAYAESLQALYPLAYTIKFASKTELGRDYVVPPLEGLWWSDDMAAFTVARDKSRWQWTMMIMTPDWIEPTLVDAAIGRVRAKNEPARLADIRWQALAEGRCVQTLHVGSFDDEAAILAQLHHRFIPEHGLQLRGTHHEIYLSDARRTPPERQRTILRQPVSDLRSA